MPLAAAVVRLERVGIGRMPILPSLSARPGGMPWAHAGAYRHDSDSITTREPGRYGG